MQKQKRDESKTNFHTVELQTMEATHQATVAKIRSELDACKGRENELRKNWQLEEQTRRRTQHDNKQLVNRSQILERNFAETEAAMNDAEDAAGRFQRQHTKAAASFERERERVTELLSRIAQLEDSEQKAVEALEAFEFGGRPDESMDGNLLDDLIEPMSPQENGTSTPRKSPSAIADFTQQHVLRNHWVQTEKNTLRKVVAAWAKRAMHVANAREKTFMEGRLELLQEYQIYYERFFVKSMAKRHVARQKRFTFTRWKRAVELETLTTARLAASLADERAAGALSAGK